MLFGASSAVVQNTGLDRKMANSQGTRLADEPKDLIEVIQNAIDKKQRVLYADLRVFIKDCAYCNGSGRPIHLL